MNNQKLIYRIDEVADILNIPEEDVWELIRNHGLKYVLIFDQRLIRHSDLEIFINRLTPL